MSDPIVLQVTNAGRAALVAAAVAGTNAVTITQVGLSAATTVVPSAAATALPGEHRRIGAIRGAAISADTIHMIVEDASSAAYDVAAFALYLSDGTLFAIYGQNASILGKSTAAIFLLAIDVKFDDIDAATIDFGDANFLNPPATIDTAGVMKIATPAEALAGTVEDESIVPKTLKHVLDSKLQGWVLKAGDTMSGRLTIAAGADECARLRATNPVLTGFNAAGSVRFGSLRFEAAATYLSSDAGAVSLCPGGTPAFTLSHAKDISGPRHMSMSGVLSVTDPNFNMGVGAGNVDFNLDAGGDFLRFNRTTNQYLFYTGGGLRFGIDATGASVSGGFSVSGPLSANGGVAIVDQAFGAGIDGSGPFLQFDPGDVYRFRRELNAHLFYVGNALKVGIDASGASVTGGFSVSGRLSANGGLAIVDEAFGAGIDGSGPFIQFDADDVYRFRRDLNAHLFYVANTLKVGIDPTGLSVIGAFNASGPITQAGYQVWHVANDGAGSGLDADLLDGLQGSAYALRSQNVTFQDVTCDRGDGTGVLYLNAAHNRYLYYDGGIYLLPGAALQVNGGNVWTAANDGSGSGLDADLLDGLHASQFWRPDNDGTGSGLDADLLDGYHASDFARIVSSSTYPEGGYRIWSDGRKECWGSGSVGGNSSGGVTYPITFDSWSKAFIEGGALIGNAQDNNPFVSGTSVVGLTVFNAHDAGLGFTWYAFGY